MMCDDYIQRGHSVIRYMLDIDDVAHEIYYVRYRSMPLDIFSFKVPKNHFNFQNIVF